MTHINIHDDFMVGWNDFIAIGPQHQPSTPNSTRAARSLRFRRHSPHSVLLYPHSDVFEKQGFSFLMHFLGYPYRYSTNIRASAPSVAASCSSHDVKSHTPCGSRNSQEPRRIQPPPKSQCAWLVDFVLPLDGYDAIQGNKRDLPTTTSIVFNASRWSMVGPRL